MNIIKMAREGLRRELTTGLHKAAARKELVRYPGLRVKTNGEMTTVHLTVRPMAAGPDAIAAPGLFLVSFEEAPAADQVRSKRAEGTGDGAGALPADSDTRVTALERELRAKEEYLQITNEELETVNAELQQKVFELSRANNDMNNLLAGTGVGTVGNSAGLRFWSRTACNGSPKMAGSLRCG